MLSTCKVFVIVLFVDWLTKANAAQIDCNLSKDPGQICSDQEENGSMQAFYFSARLGVCQPFLYHGCGGNSNRFSNAKECQNACASQSRRSKHSQWTHAERCNATHLIPDGRYIKCRHNDFMNATFSCPAGHICVDDSVCCPTKEHVCAMRDDSGTFAEGIDDRPRFAWSADIQSCWRFSYYGAHGNYNNFPDFRKCIEFCK